MTRRTMKIAALSRASGIHRSTIHYYRNLGLLPPPIRRGPKLHLYDARHLRRLRDLAALRADGLSIAALQRRYARRSPAALQARTPSRPPHHASALASRDRILDVAARAFVARGYGPVRIVDVARAAGASKATLYAYFASKAELFVACLDRLRLVVISAAERATITPALGFDDEQRMRAAAVLDHAGPYRMMCCLLEQAALDDDRALARRARRAHHRMVTGAHAMFTRAIAAGECRPIDPELLCYMTWGALLALCERLAFDDRYSTTDATAALLDFVGHGITCAPRA